VLIGTRGALIIGAALLGGFALVALVMAVGVKRVVTWRPTFAVPQLPDWDEIQAKLHRLQKTYLHAS
jgi:hypothetical protein